MRTSIGGMFPWTSSSFCSRSTSVSHVHIISSYTTRAYADGKPSGVSQESPCGPHLPSHEHENVATPVRQVDRQSLWGARERTGTKRHERRKAYLFDGGLHVVLAVCSLDDDAHTNSLSVTCHALACACARVYTYLEQRIDRKSTPGNLKNGRAAEKLRETIGFHRCRRYD